MVDSPKMYGNIYKTAWYKDTKKATGQQNSVRWNIFAQKVIRRFFQPKKKNTN